MLVYFIHQTLQKWFMTDRKGFLPKPRVHSLRRFQAAGHWNFPMMKTTGKPSPGVMKTTEFNNEDYSVWRGLFHSFIIWRYPTAGYNSYRHIKIVCDDTYRHIDYMLYGSPFAMKSNVMYLYFYHICTVSAEKMENNLWCDNTLRPRQNGRHSAHDIFKFIILNENVWIAIKISLKFVPGGPINNISALVQIMAWRRPGDKPLSEPLMVSLPTHICVARPQWVKDHSRYNSISVYAISRCLWYYQR